MYILKARILNTLFERHKMSFQQICQGIVAKFSSDIKRVLENCFYSP